MGKAKPKPYCYEHPRPSVTVDVLLVTREPAPRVLLIRRKHKPFVGMWAIPGGHVEMEETLEASALRELAEETNVRVEGLEQLHTFGDPGRDPRGRTISVVYLARVDADRLEPRAADDAAEVGWHPLHQPPPLAFDHGRILACARQRLESEGAERGRGKRAPR
jgi:8-oxo-dGTP diphosphatase